MWVLVVVNGLSVGVSVHGHIVQPVIVVSCLCVPVNSLALYGCCSTPRQDTAIMCHGEAKHCKMLQLTTVLY